MGESPVGEARRVALFVDGDNLPPSLSGPILEAAARLGPVDVRRVYAAEAGFRAWQDAAGYRPIQVGGAKNGTDLLLSIEAVELACTGGFGAFALASDDRDFSHLAHWLRERGVHVLGLGTERSPTGWRAACSGFEIVGPAAAAEPKTSRGTIDQRVSEVLSRAGAAGMLLTDFGQEMKRLNLTKADLPEGSWRGYFVMRNGLFALEGEASQTRVRHIAT